jgi:hypothetical protein
MAGVRRAYNRDSGVRDRFTFHRFTHTDPSASLTSAVRARAFHGSGDHGLT